MKKPIYKNWLLGLIVVIIIMEVVALVLLPRNEYEADVTTTTTKKATIATTTVPTTTTTATTTTTTITTTSPEIKDSYFGLTESEINYLLDEIKSKNFPCTGIEDLESVSCLGYRRNASGEWDYENIKYAVTVRSGPTGIIGIPVELLEEWNIDINDRIK